MDRITENLEYAKNQATEAWTRNMHGNSGQGSSSMMNNNSHPSYMDQARDMLGGHGENQSYMDQARGKANDMLNRAGDMMGRTQDSAKDRMSEMEPKADE
ncbi:hypothetical protein BP00DRAFT_458723 [Aspergillus indologenus CBS 114.80]|uniref:Uncharacterized protein n=1 Tax=Aspergillus indologenus CBS 114.80 TaxID=1450541 RepID=A0A2V5I4X4_9EURO|nr:hypothetical protein BP00DRAFT_458723 [Aspergillus indologenus CBS 114.80]